MKRSLIVLSVLAASTTAALVALTHAHAAIRQYVEQGIRDTYPDRNFRTAEVAGQVGANDNLFILGNLTLTQHHPKAPGARTDNDRDHFQFTVPQGNVPAKVIVSLQAFTNAQNIKATVYTDRNNDRSKSGEVKITTIASQGNAAATLNPGSYIIAVERANNGIDRTKTEYQMEIVGTNK
jgi:hypothetical protein